jgi:DNA-binding XRE family transcriptional regulator
MGKAPLTPIESLEKQLRKRFPNATLSLDKPTRRSGTWYIDLTWKEHSVLIQWRENLGFGISSSESQHYGEGADEVYHDLEAAYSRVVSLVLSQSYTSPPYPVRLKELRKERGLSQAELAAILNKQQGEVSKIERRNDVLVSTLHEYVCSIGGTLQLTARFADGQVRTIQLVDTPIPNKYETV